MVQGRKPNLERRRRIHPFTKPDTQKIGGRATIAAHQRQRQAVHSQKNAASRLMGGWPEPPPSIPLSTFLPQTGRGDRKKKVTRCPKNASLSASTPLVGAKRDTACQKKGDVIDLWAALHHQNLRAAALDLVRTFDLEPGTEKRKG